MIITIFNLSSEMGTDGPGTHGVWTCICLWACGCLECLLHFLMHMHTLLHIVHTEVWRDSRCGCLCGMPKMYPDAQRLPALCHVWGCGIFSESLSTPDAEGRSAKEMFVTAEDPQAPVPLGCCSGPLETHSTLRPATQPAAGPRVCTSPHSHPLGVSLPAGDCET